MNPYYVQFKWQHSCCISVVRWCSWYLLYPVGCRPQLTLISSGSHRLTHYHRRQTESMWSQTKKGSVKSNFKARFIDTSCSPPSIQKKNRVIQTRLKAQGNLRLVTTNVGLNSSCHYLWGEIAAQNHPKRTTHQRHTLVCTKNPNREQIWPTSTRFCISFTKKWAMLL